VANTQTLGYDHMERLLTAVSGTGGYGSLSYTYDNNSNRLTSGATTYTIASTSNRLSSVGATSIGYTTTGNMNAIGTNTMTYNKANQLATATVSGTASTYTYDAFGLRQKTVVGAGTPSIQQYDEGGNQLTETNSGVETDYVYLDGVPIAAIQPAAATISYIHADRMGTPQKATNAAKTSVWSTTYQPFGATGTVTSSITQNLRLPGQHADATGYSHNGYRNYYTSYGRYLESDPIGLGGGTNTYGYAYANPSRYSDRLGLCSANAPDCIDVVPPYEILPIAASIGVMDGAVASIARTLPILAKKPEIPVGPEAPVSQCDIAGELEKLGGGRPRLVTTKKGAKQFIFPNDIKLRFDLEPGQYLTGQEPHINLQTPDENIHINLE
jgi:RHS repeat-associated protein